MTKNNILDYKILNLNSFSIPYFNRRKNFIRTIKQLTFKYIVNNENYIQIHIDKYNILEKIFITLLHDVDSQAFISFKMYNAIDAEQSIYFKSIKRQNFNFENIIDKLEICHGKFKLNSFLQKYINTGISVEVFIKIIKP